MSARALLDVTSDLHDLTRLVTEPRRAPEVLERALASMRAVVPYDLAAIYRLHGTEADVIAAAGPLADDLVRRHRLDLTTFPTIQRALECRQPTVLEEHHHASDEGDPYDGLLDLPEGHSCMVVPLYAGDRDLGLITLDRTVCEVFPEPVVRLAGVYGQLISAAMAFADQAALLDRYRHQLQEEHRLLLDEVGGGERAVAMLEALPSAGMRDAVRLGRQVALSDLPVLILGETGSGKEVVAQAIHHWSPRAGMPFVKLNCAAIPEQLVESELFGHVKGAFSGAENDRQGRFLVANGGTLLLDEIGDMPLAAQAKLLRVLQEGTFEPLGSDQTVKVDVRVLAATHRDLDALVDEGRFRKDLLYRLDVFPLRVPALRERVDDVAVIATGALEAEHHRTGRGPWTLTREALDALRAEPWPGNVRELVNTLERATILQPEGAIGVEHLGRAQRRGAAPTPTAREPDLPTWMENEKRYFEALLARTDGQIAGSGGAAELAGLKPSTLRSRLEKHGLR